MKPKCYFCDAELEVVAHTVRFSMRDEPVCDECNMKTVNRQKAKRDEPKQSGSP